MADTGIFATTAEVQYKVGANASSVANTETYINNFMTQAESRINAESEYNWSDVYSTLNVDVKGVLKEAASNLAALYVINYDPNAWTISTATFKINVLYTAYQDCIKLLREKDKAQIFIIEA